MNFKDEAISIKNELINIRRILHQHPELGMEEYETSKFIKLFKKRRNRVYRSS